MNDYHTSALINAIRTKVNDNTWIKPKIPIQLDIPADIPNEDIKLATDSGFILRLDMDNINLN